MPNDQSPPKESMKQIEAVDKALQVLECFLGGEKALSLKQLSEMTGLYKSRILRVCGTLISHGFLIRQQGSFYNLGPKLMMLGKAYEKSNTLVSLARSVLRELASLTGESTSLFVIEGTKRLCLAREEGSAAIRYSIREGQVLELYAGAGGKALLAYAPQELRDRILGSDAIKPLTSFTIVDRERLEMEFKAIRKQGYSVSRGERVSEAAALAAPVYDHMDEVCAVITVAGPIQRFSEKHSEGIKRHLLDSARKLSALLGHSG